MNSAQFVAGSKSAQTNISTIEKQGLIANQKLSSSYGSLFKSVGGGLLVFGLLKKGLVDSIGAYIEAKDSSDRLTASLDGNIQKAKEFQEIASRIQNTTIYGDEMVNDSFTFLAGQERTEEQMRKTMSAAVDYAAFMKKDLSTAVKELSMTYDGNIGRLGRIDGRLKELTPEQLKNGAAVDLLGEKYKGWGEIIGNTVEGKVRRFQNAMGELQEGIGEGLVQSLAEGFDDVASGLLNAAGGAKELGKYIGEGIVFIAKWATIWGVVSTAIKAVKLTLDLLKVSMKDIGNAVSDANTKIANLPSKLPLIGYFYDKIKEKASEYIDKLKEIIFQQNAIANQKALREDLYTDDGRRINTKDPMNDPANDSKRDNSTNTSSPSGNTKQLQEEKKELDEIEQLQENINKLEAEHKESVAKYGPTINKFLQGQIDKIKDLKAELKELLSIEQERAREYEKNSQAEGTREMAEGTGGRSAQSDPAAVMGSEDDWIKRIGYATAIFNILNKRPQNPFQVFLMILGIAQQIALLMNAGPLGGMLGALGGLFGAFGGIFGFKDGANLSEGKIKGPGTPTSDSILAMAGNRLIRLSNKEYIVPEWMNFLYPMLDEIRLGKSNSGTRNSFASGGRLSAGAGSAFYGTLNIYEDAVVSDSFSRTVVAEGFPLWQMQKKKRGSRS